MNAAGAPFRFPAALQSLYFVVTGLWPLVHMPSFLAVTGPKDDIWLVETVGVLVAAIGATIGLAVMRRSIGGEVILLAVASAIGLGVVETIYVLRGRIDVIYLADAVAEAILVALWVISWWKHRRRIRSV